MRLIYLQIFFLTIGTACSQTDCGKYSDNYIPKDLNDALKYLTCTWTDKDKKDFKSKDEKLAVSELHMGTGQGIRNGWELWQHKNSLYHYFESKGIFHPDDISSIILTSFHRQLNNREIDLDGQVKRYLDYWNKAKEDEDKWKEGNRKKYDAFKVGDSVKMNFSLRTDEGKDRLYLGRNDLDFNENGNCVVTGIISDKKNSDLDFILLIEVKDICGRNEIQYGAEDKLVVGKTFEYNIAFHNIERL